ncbi:hypothetical protein ACKKBF_B40870 [Auxenochlorella protothecoides x Auxenochlorella symbiontica]
MGHSRASFVNPPAVLKCGTCGLLPCLGIAVCLLSLTVAIKGACTSKFYSLPSAIYGPHVTVPHCQERGGVLQGARL